MKRKTESGPKLTYVDAQESPLQYDRRGFVPVCQYGSIRPEQNEIGGIFVRVRNAQLECGLWLYDAECVERVFVTPNVVANRPIAAGWYLG